MEPLQILLVDDEPDLANLMKQRLSRDAPHFSITALESCRDCIDYLKNNHVDCILSDYQMPEMNGMQLLHYLRSNNFSTPFIFVTGQGNEAVAREAFKNGADDYFTKDILGFAYYAKIINSVEQAVRYRDSERVKMDAEAALLQEKNKLEAILANIGEGISIQDKELRVLYQNQAHINLLGRHMGEYCYWGYARRDAECEVCQIRMSIKDGGVHKAQKLVSTDKGPIHVEITASPLSDHTGDIVAGIEVVRDVTEHRRADERVARLNRLYGVITAIDNVIIRSTNQDDLFRKVCDTAVDKGSFHMAWVGLAGNDNLVRPAAYAGCEDGYLNNITISVKDIPEGRGPVGTSIRTGEHFICNDIEHEESMSPWRDRALKRGYRSNAGFPLRVGGKVVGALAVYATEPGFFDTEEVGLMDSLAANISYAMQSMRKG